MVEKGEVRKLHVGWLLEKWRRKGVGIGVLEGDMLEVTGCCERDIERVAEFIEWHKQEILAYLSDGAESLIGELLSDARLVDPFPLVCKSCPRLEMVDRGDEIMAGCLFEPNGTQFTYGWKRFPAGAAGCMWIDGSGADG